MKSKPTLPMGQSPDIRKESKPLRLEDQVVSLQLSKKLKELGFNQESLFYWSKPFDINNELTGDDLEVESSDWLEYNEMQKSRVCPAYTVSELLNILPQFIAETWALNIKKGPVANSWVVAYRDEEWYSHSELKAVGTNLADATARVLIILKERELILIEQAWEAEDYKDQLDEI